MGEPRQPEIVQSLGVSNVFAEVCNAVHQKLQAWCCLHRRAFPDKVVLCPGGAEPLQVSESSVEVPEQRLDRASSRRERRRPFVRTVGLKIARNSAPQPKEKSCSDEAMGDEDRD